MMKLKFGKTSVSTRQEFNANCSCQATLDSSLSQSLPQWPQGWQFTTIKLFKVLLFALRLVQFTILSWCAYPTWYLIFQRLPLVTSKILKIVRVVHVTLPACTGECGHIVTLQNSRDRLLLNLQMSRRSCAGVLAEISKNYMTWLIHVVLQCIVKIPKVCRKNQTNLRLRPHKTRRHDVSKFQRLSSWPVQVWWVAALRDSLEGPCLGAVSICDTFSDRWSVGFPGCVDYQVTIPSSNRDLQLHCSSDRVPRFCNKIAASTFGTFEAVRRCAAEDFSAEISEVTERTAQQGQAMQKREMFVKTQNDFRQ